MAPKGLLSIGEFSRLTGIPRSKLIYYDEIGLLPAAKRADNNYRYYALNQILTVGFINDLANFGTPLKDLLALVQHRTPEVLLEVLTKATEEQKQKIAILKESLTVMGVMSDLMTLGLKAGDSSVEIVEYEPDYIVLGGENTHQDAATFYPAWLSFMNMAKKAGININYPVGGYFENMERFIANPGLPSRFYFINPHGKDVRSGGKWLAGYVRGFYGQPGDLIVRMLDFAKENNLELTGPVYNTFLFDETSTVDPDQYLMRASVKIAEDE
ncbi:MAG: MerR family DNA-binding transcriptional regulator [Coriobacteriales bacterium]|jgi:DNA-binding transcriptional MerR regulator|nr:MerR family DNA-binding transcriptional regulator [Coriobacteriales bacterium]